MASKTQQIAWTDDLSVGNETLDTQHKGLIELINGFGQDELSQSEFTESLEGLIAYAARHFNDRLPKRLRNNLAAARTLLDRRRGGALAIGGLFVFSPLPSAQLFVAAGLLELNLAPLIAAFFVGRLLSYSLYASAATLADSHLHGGVAHLIGSPWAIALQVALLALVCAFPFINWAGMLDRQQERHGHRGGTPTT